MGGTFAVLPVAAFYLAVAYAMYYVCRVAYLKYKYSSVAKRKRSIVDKRMLSVIDQLVQFSLPDGIKASLRKMKVAEIHEELLLPGKVTCVDLVKFYTKETYHECYHLNYLVDFLYEEAIEMAHKKDEELKKYRESGQPLPLLFGIPISIKDVLEYKGHDTSMGSAHFCFSPEQEHGLAVELLIAAGAIPFVKTNCPQLLLINETNNWIWGRAKNPWDTERSTGGSSGGEGGLVAMGCSPLGIGSDGGGSIRIPSNYCGIYGIRPTGKRFTWKGHKPPSSYVPRHIYGCIGPLAKSIDDCSRCLQALQNYDLLNIHDPALPTLEWNNSIAKQYEEKKLKVGVIYEHEVFKITPTQRRAIDETVEALKKKGHQVHILTIDQTLIQSLIDSFMVTAIMNHTDRVNEVGGESVIPEFFMMSLITYLPHCLRGVVAKVVRLFGQIRLGAIMDLPILRENTPLL